jgi:hypothetical protein
MRLFFPALPIQSNPSSFLRRFPIIPKGRIVVKTRIYYEIHSKRGHVKTTDDKIDVREALDKNLLVVEVQETAFYLKEAVVKTLIFQQIKSI